MRTKCEQCGKPPVTSKDRFCKECKKKALAEMKAAGYLTIRYGLHRTYRSAEMMENVRETKHGRDG